MLILCNIWFLFKHREVSIFLGDKFVSNQVPVLVSVVLITLVLYWPSYQIVKPPNLTTDPLLFILCWQEVSSSGIHLMAATPYSDLPCNRGEETSFLLALAGRKPHKLFACALATDMHWATLQQQTESPEEGVTR